MNPDIKYMVDRIAHFFRRMRIRTVAPITIVQEEPLNAWTEIALHPDNFHLSGPHAGQELVIGVGRFEISQGEHAFQTQIRLFTRESRDHDDDLGKTTAFHIGRVPWDREKMHSKGLFFALLQKHGFTSDRPLLRILYGWLWYGRQTPFWALFDSGNDPALVQGLLEMEDCWNYAAQLHAEGKPSFPDPTEKLAPADIMSGTMTYLERNQPNQGDGCFHWPQSGG